ncbi:serine hydrolase domain-containing protein [Streptomyces sp. NPDC050388]|uniref:serine hydrolase domain-containing protein n=1 Tax=Streptomyces sp. NPDC050388 TaxID=3155781 RepID=UPI0034390F38
MKNSMRIPLRHAAASAVALLLALLLCGLTTPAVAAPAPASGRYAALDAYIHERMKATHSPGLSYAVVGPNGPIHQRSWGYDGNGEPVTAQTPFLWGSVAKPIAASGVMALVQDGRLRLEDRVVAHLPHFRFGGADHASRVTVRHLLYQTAGIPESATFQITDCLGAGCPRPAERIGALDDIQPLGAPGTTYAYSSANYLILSAVAESITGIPFAEHLKEAVFEPAGMDGAIADRTTARERDLPPGHQLMWGVPTATAEEVDDHGAGYGYVGGDLEDLAAFASFQLRSGRTADGDTVLTPESVHLMREEGTLGPEGATTGYGLGWRVGGLPAPLDDAVWHTGATPGYSAMLFLLPKQNTAVVVQQNLHGLLHDEAVMEVGFGAARILADGEAPDDQPSSSAYHTTIWGITLLAAALLLTTVRSALLLRRPAAPTSVLRRTVLTALWCLAGALPWIALWQASAQMPVDRLMTWLPDAFITVCVAAVAGTTTAVLRLVLALRSTRARASRPERGHMAAH